MKRFGLYLGIIAGLVASCSTKEKDFQTPQLGSEVFYATFEQPSEDGTRVFANEDLLLRWTADDRVSIFNKNTYNQQYKFTGETGDNAGSFDKVAGAEFTTGNAISHIVSVYPYQESTKISESESITVTLPAEQHYADNTFGLGANTMVSVSSDNLLMFKNVGGYLRLRLYGEGVSVSSIILKGNNGEKLAGKATVTMSQDGTPTVALSQDATEEITLICDTPVSLGDTVDNCVDFWFVIPPVSFSRGFKVTIVGSGGVHEKTTGKIVTVERNKLSKMSPIEVQLIQPKNVIFYTSTDGKIITPNKTDVFGADIVSNDYIEGVGIMTFNDDVTSIGDYAFFLNSSLSSITIPNGVTSIGDSAFSDCESLVSLSIPNSVTSIGEMAFTGCSSLISISIPDSVTSIGELVFMYCSALTSVTLSEGLTSIPEAAFYQCPNLTSITIPNRVKSIGYYSFGFCSGLTSITLPDSVSSIERAAFSECSSLKSINIPSGVTSIAENTFSRCSNLISITLPDSVTSIGKQAFSDCSSLTGIIIPEGVTSIGDAAFMSCSSLTSISIPNSVSSIGFRAFARCYSLQRFSGKYASDDGLFLVINDAIASVATSSIGESVSFPKGVTSIESFAFSNCSRLTSISIPSSVTSIGNSAFARCSSLTSITIPERVTSIGIQAFALCSSLTNVYIGEGVTSIGESAFYGCTSLLQIILLPETPPSGAGGAFNDTNNCPIYVPSESVEAYKTAQCWSDYADRIQAISQPTNIICYTSSDGTIVTPKDVFDASIVSNEYSNGLGIITFDRDVRSVGEAAFSQCQRLTSINLPANLRSIGRNAFSYCTSLANITTPEGLTSIGSFAFINCSSLSNITIPESVISIGDHAFSGCSSLSSITIPESVTSIMEETFHGCYSLLSFNGKYASSDGLFLIDQGVLVATALGAMNGSISIPNNVSKIGLCAFENCTNLTSITIPDSVTRIGKYAFYDCSNLRDITISNSVTSIDPFAFFGCSSITVFSIPNTVKVISDSAFYGCTSLAQITIPTSVNSIGRSAFEHCDNLASIIVLPSTPPSGADSMFEMISNVCPIYVPAGSVDEYKAAQYWSDYANRIIAIGTPQAVDLGLSVKWASFNLGATKPEEYGDYYAWGETEPYYSSQNPFTWKNGKEAGYTWASYKFELGTDAGGPFSKYVIDSSFGTVDNKTVLDPEDDAAYVNWGESWRMPTYEEWAELGENCTWTWTTQNNVKGRLVTGPNGNSIFLPAAGILDNTSLYIRGSGGYYWSSSVMLENSYNARNIGFESDGVFWNHCNHPIRGFSVRPVAD